MCKDYSCLSETQALAPEGQEKPREAAKQCLMPLRLYLWPLSLLWFQARVEVVSRTVEGGNRNSIQPCAVRSSHFRGSTPRSDVICK